MAKTITPAPDDPGEDNMKNPPSESSASNAVKPEASEPKTAGGDKAPVEKIPPTTGGHESAPAEPNNAQKSDEAAGTDTNPAITNASKLLKGVLLPPSFAGFGVTFEATVPLFERPANNNWFRVHADIAFDVLTFKSKDKRTRYVADFTNTPLVEFLRTRNAVRPTRCYAYMLNDGTLGFWPVFLEGNNGKPLDSFNQSAHIIAEKAKEAWKAIITGKDSYKVASAPDNSLYGQPQWPEDLKSQFARAVENFFVPDLEHPEMLEWQGKR